MEYSEKLKIANELQKHHYIFRCFWDIGEPVVDDFPDLSTAAIEFDKQGNSIKLLINKTFWGKLNDTTKLFLICHEMMHIFLNHGSRFVEYMNKPEFSTMNIAADVVINELLVNYLNFDRTLLNETIAKKGCWIDTVFAHDSSILSEQSTEYYFYKLLNNPPPSQSSFKGFDEHRIKDEGDVEGIDEILKANGVFDQMSQDFLENAGQETAKDLEAGKAKGKEFGLNFNKKIKSKWETVIKKWEKFTLKETFDSNERWERVSPRYSHVMSDKLKLPSETKTLDAYKVKNKHEVFFFLDTSGSCIHLANRFFKAANSLNPKYFNVRPFCFDTSVYEVDMKSKKAIGGGGTAFNIIENKIQNIIKTEKIKYPISVWIITDGYGNHVNPQFPKNWYWFLTEHASKSYIPNQSKIFELKNYE